MGQQSMALAPPRLVVAFSGKRKSGKDFVTEKVCALLNEGLPTDFGLETAGTSPNATIGRLSAPLKAAFAQEHGLDFQELLSDGSYKEQYRAQMITWGEEQRIKSSGYFAELVLQDVCSCAEKRPAVLIISDARRQSDMEWFRSRKEWDMIAVRVLASEGT